MARRVNPWMAAEDPAFYAREVTGFFFMPGVVKPGSTSGDHHSATFMAADGAVPVGIRVMSQVIVDYLRGAAAAR